MRRMKAGHMRRFWDARAREDAFYFVDNTGEYRSPDTARFWASGDHTLQVFSERLGVEVQPSDTVLDIGCGLGRITRALAGRCSEVVAIDVSADMLARARELNAQLANVTWLHGDGVSLAGVDPDSIDAIMSFVVFQHIPDPRITLGYVREMGRVLRPGGWSAFQVSNDPGVHTGARRSPGLRARAAQLFRRAPRGQADPAWLGSAVDLDELEVVADAAGMDVERVDGRGRQFCLVVLRRRG
jgi:SAM-dependent methyltransferase